MNHVNIGHASNVFPKYFIQNRRKSAIQCRVTYEKGKNLPYLRMASLYFRIHITDMRTVATSCSGGENLLLFAIFPRARISAFAV
jgi:hypothetical protein